jgi:hypothetical protein
LTTQRRMSFWRSWMPMETDLQQRMQVTPGSTPVRQPASLSKASTQAADLLDSGIGLRRGERSAGKPSPSFADDQPDTDEGLRQSERAAARPRPNFAAMLEGRM